jgi:hypothetical protein
MSGITEVGERERAERVDLEWPFACLGQAPIGAMTTPGAISSVIRASAMN